MVGAATATARQEVSSTERLMSVDDALRLARAHLERGALDEASRIARQIAEHKRGHPDAFHIMAVAAFRSGRLDKAIAHAERAIARAPKTAAFWSNLAEMLRRRGFLERAFSAASRAVTLDPGQVQGWNNLGVIEFERRNFIEAERACRRALDLDSGSPAAASAWNNLGNALCRLERDEEAHAAYARAIALRPGYCEAMVNDALGWRDEACFDRAVTRLDEAIAVSPRNANAHLSRAIANFLRGETAQARVEYEWRLALPRAAPSRLSGARWRGEDIGGRRIFIFAEQGLGDTIQSLRHLHALTARRPASISLLAPRNLRGLIARNFPGVELVVRPAAADFHCALMSLPLLLDGSKAAILPGEPYLTAEPERVAAWRERLGAFPGRKVGLVWAGNGTYQNDHNRSMQAAMLAPLLNAAECSFFSLQIGPSAGQVSVLRPKIEDLGGRVSNMSETAAAIAALDLVISVDTSLAHLAGALGRPVWTMLPHVPDWRWGMEGETNPLYGTMRLFRQTVRRDWAGVVADVRAALDGAGA